MAEKLFKKPKRRYVAIARCAQVICLCALALSLPSFAFALKIDNPKISVALSKGQSYSGSIVVENNSDKETRIRVYAEDFLYIAPFDGSKEFFPLGTTRFSFSSSLTMPSNEFILAPYDHQTVNFILRPQEDFDRVRCGVIFFETALGKTTGQQGEGIDILGRVGSLVFIEPKGKQKKGEFADIRVSDKSLEGIFTNKGNTFLRVQGTYYTIDSHEMVKERGQTPEFYLLPDDQTKITIVPSAALPAGNYTMVITFDMEGGEAVVKEINFSVSATGTLEVLAVSD